MVSYWKPSPFLHGELRAMPTQFEAHTREALERVRDLCAVTEGAAEYVEVRVADAQALVAAVEELKRLAVAARSVLDADDDDADARAIMGLQRALDDLGRPLAHYWPTSDEWNDALIGDQVHAAVRRAQETLAQYGGLCVILAVPRDDRRNSVLGWMSHFLGAEVLSLSAGGDVVLRRP